MVPPASQSTAANQPLSGGFIADIVCRTYMAIANPNKTNAALTRSRFNKFCGISFPRGSLNQFFNRANVVAQFAGV